MGAPPSPKVNASFFILVGDHPTNWVFQQNRLLRRDLVPCLWVLDGGMVSEDDFAFLRDRKAHYLVGTPKAHLRRFEQALLDHEEWQEVERGMELLVRLGVELPVWPKSSKNVMEKMPD